MKKLLGIAAILAVLTLTFVGCKPTTGITDDVENKQNSEEKTEKTEKAMKDLTSEEIAELITSYIAKEKQDDYYGMEYFFEDENYYFFNTGMYYIFALSKDMTTLIYYYILYTPKLKIYKKSFSKGDFISLPMMNTAFISKRDYKTLCDMDAYLDKSATKPILTPQCFDCENEYLKCVLINYSALAVDNEEGDISIAVYNKNGELTNTHIKIWNSSYDDLGVFSPIHADFPKDLTAYEGLKYGDLAIGELKNLPDDCSSYLEKLNSFDEKSNFYYKKLLELLNSVYRGQGFDAGLLDKFKVLYEIAKY